MGTTVALGVGENGGGSQDLRHLHHIWGCWAFELCCCRWGGVQSHVARGFGPCHCCCSLPCGHGHGCSQEAGSCALPPLLLLGSLGCGTQSLQQGSQDCRYWFHFSPGSASFMCSSPPTFRGADVQIFPGSWCVGQGKLC